jgi:hypothetical protein
LLRGIGTDEERTEVVVFHEVDAHGFSFGGN